MSPAPLQLSSDDLDEVTPLLYDSGGVALCWWRIQDSDLGTTSSGEILHQGYRLQALQAAMRREKIELAHQILGDAGIDAILLKGWAAARFYPNPALRPLGDIDLLVKASDYDAANAALENPEARTCWVDLHNALSELDDCSLDELFARSKTEMLGDTRVRVLSTEDQLALSAIHFFKHGAWRPVWLCDIGAMIESLPANFDWNICFGSTRNRSAWITAAIVLAHQLLAANIDTAPLAVREKHLPEWLVDAVLKQWGNLFHADHLPVQPRPLLANSWRSPRILLKEIRARWPDPIVATFDLRGRPNNFPRLPYQLGAFAAGAGRYLVGHLGAASRSRALPS